MAALGNLQDALRDLREAESMTTRARRRRDEALRQAREEAWTSGDLQRLCRVPVGTTCQAWRGAP